MNHTYPTWDELKERSIAWFKGTQGQYLAILPDIIYLKHMYKYLERYHEYKFKENRYVKSMEYVALNTKGRAIFMNSCDEPVYDRIMRDFQWNPDEIYTDSMGRKLTLEEMARAVEYQLGIIIIERWADYKWDEARSREVEGE